MTQFALAVTSSFMFCQGCWAFLPSGPLIIERNVVNKSCERQGEAGAQRGKTIVGLSGNRFDSERVCVYYTMLCRETFILCVVGRGVVSPTNRN